MIQEYEKLYKIYMPRQKYRKRELRTMELENLKARIDCLEEEHHNLVQTIYK